MFTNQAQLPQLLQFKNYLSVFCLILFVLGLAGCNTAAANNGKALGYYHFMRSYYAEMDRNDNEATRHMEKASLASGDSYYLQLEAARMFSRMGKNDKAIEHAEKAITLNGQNLEAKLFLAWIYASNGQWEEAETQYKNVLAQDANNQEAMAYLGALYAETNQLAAAEETFKRLVKVDTNPYLSYYSLGRIYQDQGRLKEAVTAYNEAVKKNPDFTSALTELSILYEQLGDYRSAEKTYRELIKVRPEANMPKARLARLLLKSGRKNEANQLLKEAHGEDQDTSQTQLQIGLIYFDQNLYEEAGQEFSAVLKADPANDQARYLLANALMASGDTVKAREMLIQIPPESNLFVEANLFLASTASDGPARLEEARAILLNALKERPDDGRLILALSMVYEEMDHLDEAKKVLNEGLEQNPESAELYFRLGVINDKQDDKDGTIANMKKALEFNPNHAEALNYLAYTWAERNENLKEAMNLAQKANELKPENGFILDTIAWIYFVQGQTEKALPLLEKAARISNYDPVIVEHLGDALAKIGRPNSAIDFYRRAKEQGHENPGLLDQKIEKLQQ